MKGDDVIERLRELEKSPPADIPEADWAGILKGSAFAGAVHESTAGHDHSCDDDHADSFLDYAGEIEEALRRRGYVIVRSDGASQ